MLLSSALLNKYVNIKFSMQTYCQEKLNFISNNNMKTYMRKCQIKYKNKAEIKNITHGNQGR